MIVHATDGVTRLSSGRGVGYDASSALLAPFAALPIDLVLVGSIAQVSVPATVKDAIACGSLDILYVIHGLGLANALGHWPLQRGSRSTAILHCKMKFDKLVLINLTTY